MSLLNHFNFQGRTFVHGAMGCQINPSWMTNWWSAIILLKKGNMSLVEEMWWNHLDSTPH